MSIEHFDALELHGNAKKKQKQKKKRNKINEIEYIHGPFSRALNTTVRPKCKPILYQRFVLEQ